MLAKLTPVSIHAPLAGRDSPLRATRSSRTGFNPRAPCGARLWCGARTATPGKVSIHAPLAGRDLAAWLQHVQEENVSIHAPLAGRDSPARRRAGGMWRFQSTRPLRGATAPLPCPSPIQRAFQSTRPLRGATLRQICGVQIVAVSIHAPLAGRDADRQGLLWL